MIGTRRRKGSKIQKVRADPLVKVTESEKTQEGQCGQSLRAAAEMLEPSSQTRLSYALVISNTSKLLDFMISPEYLEPK